MRIRTTTSTTGLRLLVAALCAAGALTACGSDADADVARGLSDSGECDNPWRIGNFGFATVNQVTQGEQKAMEKAAKGLCATVTLEDGGFDSQRQLRQMQDALAADKYDAWAIGPIDGSLIQNVVEQAIEAGIKVSSYEFPIGPDQLNWETVQTPGMTITVGEPLDPQIEEIVNLIRRACADRPAPCGVIDFYGQRATSPFDAYRYEQMNELLGEEGIDVLQSLNGNYSPADSRAAIKDAIARFGDDIDVVACYGDQMCFGAQQAYDERGAKPGTNAYPALISAGAAVQGIEGVQAGKWYATTNIPIADQGRIQIESLVADLQGEEIPYPNPLYPVQDIAEWGASYDQKDAQKYPDVVGQWDAG
jgi:ribose transport system substrate-binding protein